MALNLKTLGTRSLSGAIFVLVFLSCVWYSYSTFCLFFLAVSLLGLREFFNLSPKFGLASFNALGLTLGLLLYLSSVRWWFFFPELTHTNWNLAMVLIPFLILANALFVKNKQAFLSAMYTISGLFYAVLPFTLINALVFNKQGTYEPQLFIGIIFLIWSNDTFAYLGGSLFGKHKLIERISPGKTWEGTIFGVLVTFVVSFLLQHYLIAYDDNRWYWLGFLVPILATIGDLVESLFKRQAGVKDTGSIMPGHGGVLDRFDSLIFVTPIVHIFLANF